MNRIDVNFESLPEGLEQVYVPRLILQPLIENAYNHGLKNKVRGGIIQIKFTFSEKNVRLIVEDNGDELTEEALSRLVNNIKNIDPNMESTGILNVNRSLKLKYGSGGGIEVSRSSLGGLRVEVKVILTE
jgi:two-component system sensor histidine kinase YesM